MAVVIPALTYCTYHHSWGWQTSTYLDLWPRQQSHNRTNGYLAKQYDTESTNERERVRELTNEQRKRECGRGKGRSKRHRGEAGKKQLSRQQLGLRLCIHSPLPPWVHCSTSRLVTNRSREPSEEKPEAAADVFQAALLVAARNEAARQYRRHHAKHHKQHQAQVAGGLERGAIAVHCKVLPLRARGYTHKHSHTHVFGDALLNVGARALSLPPSGRLTKNREVVSTPSTP